MRHTLFQPVVIAEEPPRRFSGGTAHPRASDRHKLDDDGHRVIPGFWEQRRALREIAAEVGVSHETSRADLAR